MAGWIVLGVIIVFLLALRVVKQEERAAVQFLGKFHRMLGPGPHLILPGIMKIRKRVPTWQLSIPLFDSSTKIDFVDGWAFPKNAEVFVRMKSPDTPYSVDGSESISGAYRAIYEIDDWKAAIKNRIENATRTYLNRLTVDDAITMGKAGFDLVNHDPDLGLPNTELTKIEKALAEWGWELRTITIGDFDLDPTLTKARSKVHEEAKAAEAADYVIERQAKEWIGMVVESFAESRGKTKKEIQKEIDSSENLQREFLDYTKMINLRLEEAERNAVVHVVVDGRNGEKGSGGGNFLGNIEEMIIRILAAKERMPKGMREKAIEEKTEEAQDEEAQKTAQEIEDIMRMRGLSKEAAIELRRKKRYMQMLEKEKAETAAKAKK